MKLFKFNRGDRPAISDDDALRLTRSFLDGATGPDQERLLYDYYRQPKIAPGLLHYRQMFEWYASLDPAYVRRSRRRLRPAVVAAALTPFVLLALSLVISRSGSTADFGVERIYAGSYIIRDGHKISDIDEILPALQRADHFVDSTLSAAAGASCDDIEERMIRQMLSDIDDPEVRAMVLDEIK